MIDPLKSVEFISGSTCVIEAPYHNLDKKCEDSNETLSND
jgi:hypothetical protein